MRFLLAVLVGGLIAAALPTQGQAVTTSLPNFTPTITSVSLSSSALDPTPGATTPLTVTINVADDNGYLDVTSVTVSLLEPGTTVFSAAAAATRTSGSGLTATYTKSYSMQFYDPADTYTVKVVIHDLLNLAQVTDQTQSFTYSSMLALSAPASLGLGTNLNPGDVGSATSLSITNTANTAIDVSVSGTALSHATESATIAASSIKYSLAAGMTSPVTLSGTPTPLTTFSLAKGASSSKSLYFQLTVPSVAASPAGYLPAGTYTGTMTLTAVADT